jgi:hypothetical protein
MASIENLVALLMTPAFADQLQLMNPLLSAKDIVKVETVTSPQKSSI